MIISIFFVLVWVLELSYSFVQFKSFHGISTKKYLQSLIVDDRSNLQKLPWNKNGLILIIINITKLLIVD
jgi:hypothetical protein